MSFRSKLLSVSMEDDSVVVGATEVAETGAQELLEVNEVAAEVSDTETVIEELHDSGDQLETVAAAMESMINDGRGLSADAAMFANMAVASSVAKFGLSAPMPSMESFIGGATGQLNQTRISLEGVKDTIKKIWEWIKAQFSKLRVYMKDFWLKTFDGAARLKKRAEAMMKKAEGITTSVTGDKAKVTVSADLVAKLHVGGNLNVEAGITTIKAVTDELLGKIDEAQMKVCEDAVAVIDKADFSKDAELGKTIAAYDLVWQNFSKITMSVLTEDASTNKAYAYVKEAGSLLKAVGSKELPGGQQVVLIKVDTAQLSASSDLAANLKAVGKMRGIVGAYAEKTPEAKEKKEATLPASKIASICEEVMAVATSIEAFKRNFQNQEKVKDAFMKAGKHVETESAKADGLSADNQKLAGAFARSILVVPSIIDQPSQKLAQYSVSTLNAVLNFAQLSLSQYK